MIKYNNECPPSLKFRRDAQNFNENLFVETLNFRKLWQNLPTYTSIATTVC